MPPWVAPEMSDSGADPALKLPPLNIARDVKREVESDFHRSVGRATPA
jgi:hypothetical protein